MTSDVPAWSAFDPDAPPALPDPGSSRGRIVALVATDGAVRGGWAGTLAVQMAASWTASGRRLVLADAGFAAPTVHQAAGVADGEGLADLLLWGASVQRVARRSESHGVFVVPAGTALADGAEALEKSRWGALCAGFRDAGVTFAVLVPETASGLDSVLREATEVVLLSEMDEEDTGRLQASREKIVARVGPASTLDTGSAASDVVLDEPVLDVADLAPEPEGDEAAAASAQDWTASPEAAPVDDDLVLDVGELAPDPTELMGADEDAGPEDGPAGEVAAPALESDGVEENAPPDEEVLLDEDALPVDIADLAPEAEEPASTDEATSRPNEAVAAFGDDLEEFTLEPEGPAPSSEAPVARSGPDEELAAAPLDDLSDAEPPVADARRDDAFPDLPGPPTPTFEELVEEAEAVPERRSGRRTTLLVLLLVILVAVAVAAWLGYVHIPGITPESGGSAVSMVEVPTVDAAEPARETSPEQGFSVAVASYQDAQAAAALARELSRSAPDVLFITAPVDVAGTVYHRVLAGPAPDSTSADGLRLRIGHASHHDPSGWLVRPTPRAFLLAESADQASAQGRVKLLHGMEIPAYLLAEDYSDGSTRFRVYAGAYTDDAEASVLSGLLEAHGITATLAERTGRLPE